MDEARLDVAAVKTSAGLPGINPEALELIAQVCDEHAGPLCGFIHLHPRYPQESLPLLSSAVGELGFRA